MARFMEDLKSQVKVALVGGSDLVKIAEQLGGDDVIHKFDYVFAENGLVAYKEGQQIGQQNILKHMGEEVLQKVINFSLHYMSQLTLPAKRGTFIEFRSSMINICPVGRSCSQAERDAFAAYDQEHQVREKFKLALEKEFQGAGLQFAIGGQISIDVFPEGWNKTYCLRFMENDVDTIHFFGDKTEKTV
ncbi:hypothetical protein DPMN_181558 [Dreissena polymorpha]|uniref:Phosphomannomutase n=2 Tax=Dreissena polymorpha TaxID=45954 RepID=A0A9D4DDY3_DREPO|nr:hypothetical protein DPMN_181558 [Dreissena polymorpha]